MNDLHTLYTDGQDVLRIVKYVHPTPSIDGHFILARDDKGCAVTLQDFLKDWKVFNSAAAFADYLLYTDEVLMDYRKTDDSATVKHMMMWTKGRCLEVGKLWSTPIMYSDLLRYF
jgi:hypothetical protein